MCVFGGSNYDRRGLAFDEAYACSKSGAGSCDVVGHSVARERVRSCEVTGKFCFELRLQVRVPLGLP